MATAKMVQGVVPGLERPALAGAFPTVVQGSLVLVLDVGASVDCSVVGHASLSSLTSVLHSLCDGCAPRAQKAASESESTPLRVLYVLWRRPPVQYRRLPFCGRCLSVTCPRCRSSVRVSIRISTRRHSASSDSGQDRACYAGRRSEDHQQPDATAFHQMQTASSNSRSVQLPPKPNRGG
jgi:hypothetical protein